MAKLVIVESPTKARVIGKMLGPGFRIAASMGHIRDLPEDRLGIDVENGFLPAYVETPRSRSVLRQLRESMKGVDEVYLAPDPDREGEAIAWHLYNALSERSKVPFHRISFHEITREAIRQAMAAPGQIDQSLVDAQQARRVLDRLVGYQVSPLLWRKLEKGSSAGRVQSVALRLVVEREREIAAFVPEEYWSFAAKFQAEAGVIQSRLSKIDGGDFKIANGDDAAALENAVKNGGVPVAGGVKRQSRRRMPYPPFTTSTLQQSANVTLRYSASATMRYAQQLYEGIELGDAGATGLITYMRTDSVTVAREAQAAAADFIRKTYGDDYVPAKYNVYRNKAAAQEAHEAIRPTDVSRTPEMVAPYLEPSQLKLYTLIWKRFVASQMSPAQLEQSSVAIRVDGADGKEYTFTASTTVTLFPGFTRLYDADDGKNSSDSDARLLGSVKDGDLLKLNKFESTRKFTEPPPRYSEAALIKELESNNIGRPSTYATILRTIQDRAYVKREQGKLRPTELGFSVWDFLQEKLPSLFEVGFTAGMEDQLDKVEEGKIAWQKMMEEFYGRFKPWLEAARDSDRPGDGQSSSIISLLEDIPFDAPRKVGRRTYDDRKFFDSVNDAFRKNGKISARQYQALLAMAARYWEKLPQDKLGGLDEDVRQAVMCAVKEQAEAEEKRDVAASEQGNYSEVFSAFDNIVFDPPVKRGRITYDDKKFFTSLKTQSAAGKPLSDKQVAAMKKLVQRYLPKLAEPEKIAALLEIQPVAAENPSTAAAGAESAPVAVAAGEAGAMLKMLSEVKEWAAPVQRGRYTYDDRKFYQSLAKQYSEGRSLSVKQLAALKKLADKYKDKQ